MRRNVTITQAEVSNIRKHLALINRLANELAALTTQNKISSLVGMSQPGFYHYVNSPQRVIEQSETCYFCFQKPTDQGSEMCNSCRELYGDIKKEEHE